MKKHSITLRGHRTSLSLEEEFWSELQAIARRRKISLQGLIEEVDRTRKGNLSSALRVYVFKEVQKS